MKSVLFAVAATALVVGNAWAEGRNAVEMPRGTARPIMGGQSGVDSGSESMPVFGGTTRYMDANPIVSDTGSEATPFWAPAPPPALALK